MHYIRAFTFLYQKPKTGWNNLLMGVVCQLIPLVGPIVWIGYRSEVAEDLDDDPEMRHYRDFNFNHFGDYLGRGIWVFLLQLIAALFGVGVGMACGFGAMYGFGQGQPPEIVLLLGLGGYSLALPVIFAAIIVLWPMEQYASLTGKFSFGGGFAFARRFLKVMWKETVVAVVAYTFLAMALSWAGFLACLVGIYPAIALMTMAEGHVISQLYQRYLDYGGEPIRPREMDDREPIFDDDDA